MKVCLHMVKRKYWLGRIETAWRRHNVVWLAGVRRAGKTRLCQALDNVEYFDCERPAVRRQMEDPEAFLKGLKGKRAALDEIHRLGNPSELLKLAADHYPDVRIVATGSSSLGASSKFGDTLTGRKSDVWLTPMIMADALDFKNADLPHRLLHGGLPPYFMAASAPDAEIQDWLDSYWSKDVQTLFRLERRASFQKFFELLLAQSGGIFEAAGYAAPCEVSRPTIANFLAVLEATYVAQVLKPYSTHRPSEIVAAPKVYGFDTGFVCAMRGWDRLRADDMGILWEHLVLNEMLARLGRSGLGYWRDKRGHEIDFVLARRGRPPVAIECKWQADRFDPAALKSFRGLYPAGQNFLVAHDVDAPFMRRLTDLDVEVCSLDSLIERLAGDRRNT